MRALTEVPQLVYDRIVKKRGKRREVREGREREEGKRGEN
jgi:hypothetical protein